MFQSTTQQYIYIYIVINIFLIFNIDHYIYIYIYNDQYFFKKINIDHYIYIYNDQYFLKFLILITIYIVVLLTGINYYILLQ